MAEVAKIDSNVTGLMIAEEESLGTLPAQPVWYGGEPSQYSDFGLNVTLTARQIIRADRMPEKGGITDIDASGGYEQDLTFTNLSHLFPGMLWANRAQKSKNYHDAPSAADNITGVSGTAYELGTAGGAKYQAGDLLMAQGFSTAGNNGLKVVTAVSTDDVQVSGLTLEASPPSGASIQRVGHQFDSADVDIDFTAGELPLMTVTSGDPTTLDLIPGEWIFIGGDLAAERFSSTENNGWCRISSVVAGGIYFDKTAGGADGTTQMSDETGTGKTIRIWFGDRIRNVSSLATEYDRKSYHVERSLGIPNPTSAPTAVQSEVIKGAVINETTFNIAQADKVTVSWAFLGTDVEHRDGVNPGAGGGDERLLSDTTGSVASIEAGTFYNTTSDFSRLKMAKVLPTEGGDANVAAPTPLFAYVTEMSFSVNNNATANKAVGVLGAFDISGGELNVNGSVTAYFSDVAAIRAIREDANVTVDWVLVKNHGSGTLTRKAGISLDLPLVALSDGRLNVSANAAIDLPLSFSASKYEPFGHVAMLGEYHWLPNLADS